jgi:hypothetical protein
MKRIELHIPTCVCLAIWGRGARAHHATRLEVSHADLRKKERHFAHITARIDPVLYLVPQWIAG